MNRFGEAEATYRRAVSIRPNYWAPYNWLGVLYYRNGDNEKAAEMFRRVTELAPENHQAFYNLGAIDYMLGKWTEAEEMFKRSIAILPNASAYSNLGTLTFSEGRFEQSAGYFKRATQLKPKDPMLWGNLGDAYKWSPGNGFKARAAYLRAVALARDGLRVNPSSSDLLGELALYEAHLSNFKQAMPQIEKALSLAPNNNQLMYYAALIYHISGQQAKALYHLRKALGSGYPAQAVRTDPEWRSLKNDQAFEDLIGSKKQ
ncbi:MAG: tetratricopeptide repeat protein [Acidobacteriota bacterium]